MSIKILLFSWFCLGICCSCEYTESNNSTILSTPTKDNIETDSELKNGDIIFQTSTSNQSKAIQLATNSPYSHVGIIYQKGDDFWVYEAVEPVKLTKLKTWIKRGKKGHYVVKRLKDPTILTKSTLKRMKMVGEQYKGKHYDLYFEWSDDRIYCSELVWKIYKEATGIALGELSSLASFDLTNPTVQQKMQERFKGNVPLDEKVISPAAIFESSYLTTILTH